MVSEPLIESILLSLFGGAAGMAIAFAATRLILHFAFPSVPGFAGVPIDASPSMPVLLFAFVISLATGVAFGMAPAWMAARVDPIEALRGASRATARAGLLPRKTLVVLQAALSLVLLSAAGLLTAALQSLEQSKLRIRTGPAPRSNHESQACRLPVRAALVTLHAHPRFHSKRSWRVLRGSLPVLAAGGGWGSGVWVDGHPAPGPRDENFAAWNRVTAGYFDVIGTPILRGRGISGQDTATSQRVAVISEAFARKFFRNEDPIGKHFGRKAEDSREFEVIGVAKDARYLTQNLDRPALPFFFLPEAQAEYGQVNLGSLFLHDIVIVTRPGANVAVAAIREAVASVDPNLPMVSIRTLREQVANQFTQQRLIARLTSFFGILSLVLASIGLYGVTAYSAGRRTSEIGVRMALGASRGCIVRLVLRGAFGLILLGLFIGLPLTYAVGRFLGSQLYGTNPYNPAVTLAAALVLGLSASAASFVPALRASLVSPSDALRAD